jgi:hypothetical protein
MSEIKLTEDEIQKISVLKNSIDISFQDLGILRRGFLNQENRILEKIGKLENDLTNFIKFMVDSKNISQDENWVLDLKTFSFKQEG